MTGFALPVNGGGKLCQGYRIWPTMDRAKAAQLFLPKSMPRTAISIKPSHDRIAPYYLSRRGGTSITGGAKASIGRSRGGRNTRSTHSQIG